MISQRDKLVYSIAAVAACAIALMLGLLVSTRKSARQASGAGLPDELQRALVLDLRFAQPDAGGSITDASGHANDGRVTGARWTDSAGHGGAYEFTTDGDRIEVPNSDSLNPGQETAAAWVKTTCQDGIWRRIIDKSFTNGFAMSIAGDWKKQPWRGKACIEVATQFAVTDTLIADGHWHQVVATFDGNAEQMFVDGQPDGKPHPWKVPGTTPTNTFNLTIGSNESDPVEEHGQSFRGFIAEPMLFDRALTPAEIKMLYDAQR